MTSAIAASRRVGVRVVIALIKGFSPFLTISSHFGESATSPGDTEFTRIGASSTTIVFIIPMMPALTTLIIVDDGYGLTLARPLNKTMDDVGLRRGSTVLTVST